MELCTDLGSAGIGQNELAAEQHQRTSQHQHGQNGHHQAQTQQGSGTLYCHRAGLLCVAHKTDEVQPDAGQEYRHTGGSLDHKGLHGKDDALLPAAGLELTVIHAVGKEQGGQHGQHSVAGEHHHARNAQQGKAVGQAGQAEHQQRAVAAQRQQKAQVKYLRTAELFAQQGVKHHHAKDLRRTAHGGKQGVGGFPACTAKVVLEEIDDEVGGKVQCRVDQHDAAYHYHSLILAEQGGEHLLYGGGLHLTGGGFFHGNANERTIFKRLEKQTNVHIDWTCFVADQFADKKNLALAQFGNLPDGLFNAGMNDYDLLRYAKQGIIIPVEHLIDKYMPNLKAIFEKYPEYRTMCTAPDGHIYSFPWIEQLGEGKEAIQAIGNIPYINKKWLDFLGLKVPETTEELEKVLIAFRDHAEELKSEFDIEGDVIPMSFIINNGDQDPAILINGFGEGYGDTGDHFAVTDEGKVIYTTVQEGYKEGIQWLHELVEQKLVDPEAFTQEWSTYVAKGKSHRYGLCFTWDISNIDNYEDYVMLPALAGPNGLVNITRQNNSETSGFDRGRCVLTTSCKNTALAAAWIDQMYAPLQSPQNNWGTYGEKDSFNIFEMGTNKDGEKMLKHMDLGNESPVEVREAQSVNGPLAVLNEYYDVYVTQPADAKWRLDNMHETYLEDMHSKYVYPNVFMSIEDTNKVTQYDTDIRKYAEQKKADWILNGGIEKEWDSYLKKMEQYGLSDYLAIKQKYFDKYQESLKSEQGKE